jgi:anti-sigma regulatory factor (Ser/Thr protein kinase)
MDHTTGMSVRSAVSVLGREPPAALHTRLEFEIAAGVQAPTVARRVVERLGAELDARRLDEVRLLVTELVTNCVRHAGISRETLITVSLELTESSLHVAVSNPGAAFDAPVPPDPGEPVEGGRGLWLVEKLADRWGIDDVHEARVWFEVTRAAAVAGP